MKIIACEQRSDEWFKARAGIPTASKFATILAKSKTSAESKTRRAYLHQLAGERITGEPAETYENAAMLRGRDMEPQARDDYALLRDVEPELIGFVTTDDDKVGASPDSFIGSDGMLEIKTAAPHILLDHMMRGEFASEHKAQCQGNLWVCEREWIDLLLYWPRMKPFIVRAWRDEAYIAELERAVREFSAEVDDVVERYRQYGTAGRLKKQLQASLAEA